MNADFLRHLVRFAIISGMVGFLIGAVGVAKKHLDQEEALVREWRRVKVLPPEGPPRMNQESIDLAIVLYGIEVPETARHPVLNLTLEDRGLSTRMAWDEKIIVEIGTAAFTSWPLLASTLAHELEVHCRQNFFLVSLMDFLYLDGTARAERQAYLHEINHAERFGLDEVDKNLIARTMNYYYSLDSRGSVGTQLGARVGQTLGRWLARETP